jgi:hypothetical protein
MMADDEFVAMVERAHGLRAEVARLGFRGSEVNANVKARLYWNPKVPPLAIGHEALADEVHTLLNDSRLSASQAAQLEREYFPTRGRT